MIDDDGFISNELDAKRDLRYAIMRLTMIGYTATSELMSDAVMMALRNGIRDIPGIRWPICHCGKEYVFMGSKKFQAKLRCSSGHELVSDVLAFLHKET